MSAHQSILIKACQFDSNGRYLEAFTLYKDGIKGLCDLMKAESNAQRKEHYKEKIREYITRCEQLKVLISKKSTVGEVVDMVPISEGSTGHSYQSLFGKYLNQNVREITIDEPYLRDNYQFINLVMFLELAVKNCGNLKCVQLTTVKDPKNPREQEQTLTGLVADLGKRGITFLIDYANIHDRQIILSNDYIIKIGRGLHFFKPLQPKIALGVSDYDFRECLETKVDIFKCQM